MLKPVGCRDDIHLTQDDRDGRLGVHVHVTAPVAVPRALPISRAAGPKRVQRTAPICARDQLN